MKSHLTRRVFRSILANEPIVHRECLRRRSFSTIRPSIHLQSTHAHRHVSPMPTPQRRTFFNLLGGGKKTVKEADIDPGLDVMMDLEKLQRMKARLPHPEDVSDALRKFFAAKRRQQGVTDTQARLARRSIQYCLDTGEGAAAYRAMHDPKFLGAVSKVMSRNKFAPIHTHVDLALLVYNLSRKVRGSGFHTAAIAYVKALTFSWRTNQAIDFVRTYQPDSSTVVEPEVESDDAQEIGKQSPGDRTRHLWLLVMGGWAKESNQKALLETLAEMQELFGPEASVFASPAMLDHYLPRDNVKEIEHWFGVWWQYCQTSKSGAQSSSQAGIVASAKRIGAILSWCLNKDHHDLGHEIVRKVMADNPPKLYWDAILVWAAGSGKGADEINRMLDVMQASNRDIPDRKEWRLPDITTINNLVEFAIQKNDPYSAERFIALGKQRNLQPDAWTYVLQMQYRLKVRDVDGALIAYTNLQAADTSNDNDVPTVNELIVALCNSKRHDFDTVMNVAADLSDRRARFEPSTVASLALLHLDRDEINDVMDLLNTHAYHFSSTERESIRKSILDFCKDRATLISQSWDGYNVLRNVFDEMPRSERTDLMINFFDRERPDMATQVFNAMRTHSRADTIPTIDTYVSAFLACAKLKTLHVLEVIHNQLKLDYNINTTTYLYNALMIGYTACGKPRRALEFWEDIATSKEGPTYNSIHIALRACEKAPFGDVKAQEIWKRLRKTNVELDQSMWASFAGALVGNGATDAAIAAIEEAEAKEEAEVDAYLVGSLFNACPGQVKQAEVEAWANEKHPAIWKKLKRIGIEMDETEMRSVKIDRSLAP